MTDREQIEEMAKIIAEYEDCGDCKKCNFHNCCSAEYHAIALYAAGYRKQVVGEWEAVINSYGLFIESCYICSSCKCEFDSAELPAANYCPTCGAKMEGGNDNGT
jgi:hypothetical protein